MDREGNYLSRSILWNDFRGEEMFPYMRERLEANGISELEDYNFTGYPFGPLATTPKFLWIKKDVYKRQEREDMDMWEARCPPWISSPPCILIR